MNKKQREQRIQELHEDAEYCADVARHALIAGMQFTPSESYWDERFKTYLKMSQKRRAEARRLQGE